MTMYPTKYSTLLEFSKKEKKQKLTQVPFVAPNSNLSSIEWCAQKVPKNDGGLTVKFCPLCDLPMIVRIQILPCEHVMCFSCSEPPSEICYICENPRISARRIQDKSKLFECDYPDCFKFFESFEKLCNHKYLVHSIQPLSDYFMLKPDIKQPLNFA